ncbi:CoA-transferase, partial [Acinetobacter baumannii]|uniref:CoA-transferase n=1 Tax=Acinetobacter baumannii TaxID=470 RepID=UPI003981D705
MRPVTPLCLTATISFSGIPAFYTQTGVGTLIAEGKEERIFNGKNYILEES